MSSYSKWSIGWATVCLSMWLAQAASASLTFNVNIQKGDDPLDTVVVVEQVGDGLRFTLTVDPSNTGNMGDLRGLFFDVADSSPSLLSGLSVNGTHVLDSKADFSGSVSKLPKGGPTIEGDTGAPYHVGIEIGTPGAGKDIVTTTTFMLLHSSLKLNVNSFFRQSTGPSDYVMAVRATSVGSKSDIGSNGGSSKTVTTGPEPTPPVPEPASLIVWLSLASVLGCVAAARKFRP